MTLGKGKAEEQGRPRRRVLRVVRSPTNPRVKCLWLECGHQVWRTRTPKGPIVICEQCAQVPE